MFNFLKKNIRSSDKGKDMLDDVSYIREIRHIPGTWHQYLHTHILFSWPGPWPLLIFRTTSVRRWLLLSFSYR